jgi:hypothetical protein
MLLEAGRAAIELGAGRVVWSVHAGVPGRPEELDLDAASREADRALLVTRLLALDAESHGVQSIRIEPPLADLTDRQLVELALDLDAPIRLCGWWSDVGSDEHARWMGALDACGAHEHLS